MIETKNDKIFHDKEIQKIIRLMNESSHKKFQLKRTKVATLPQNLDMASNSNVEETRACFRDRCKSFYEKIAYAIPPFILFISVLVFTYFGNQLLYEMNGGVGGSDFPHIPLDDKIPLISWFVYPYFFTFPLGIVAFFYLAYSNKKAFYVMFRTLVICFAISGIIYLFWQTRFTKPDFVPVTFTDKLVTRTWGSTYPVNCFPSQHAFMAIGIIIGCLTGGKKMKWWFKAISIPISIMILLATFFVKQHFFLDWVASLAIMLVVYAVVLLYYFLKEKKAKKNNK